MRTARTYYFNADFDLSLRGETDGPGPTSIARQIDELSLQALIGTAPGDAALVRSDVPAGFLEYLDDCGLNVPRVLRHPASDPSSRLEPLGWSAEAIELNRRHEDPAVHPPLDVVRRVNGRTFALEFERELCPEGPLGRIVLDEDELDRVLLDAPPSGGWVLKAEHGNAALGNRRLRGAPLTDAERRFSRQRLAEDGRLLVEPWLSRTRDWSTVFDVPFDAASCRLHQAHCTADGAVVGAMFEPEPRCPHREELQGIAARLAERLAGEGYHGPVCLDSFEWLDDGRRRFRKIVDINCRHALSNGVHRAWRTNFAERSVLYRFISRRRLTLPPGRRELLDALGDTRYRATERRGIMLAAPETARSRLALLFVGHDRADVETIERSFIERFARVRP